MRIGRYVLYAALLVFDSAHALDASLYYPLQAGNQWTFSVNRTDGPTWTGVYPNTAAVASGTVLVNGASTTRVTETNGDITYYTSDSNGVRIHREYDGEDFIEFTFSPSFRAVNANFNIGDNITGQTGTVSSAAYGVLPYTASSSVTDGGTVSVPAGTYTNTVKVTTTIVVNTSSLSGFPSNVTTQDVLWLAEHIGPVKGTYEYTDSTDANERIFESDVLTSTNIVVPAPASAKFDEFINWKPLIKETVASSPGLESITPLANFVDTNSDGYADRIRLAFNVWKAGTNTKLFKTQVMSVELPPSPCISPINIEVDFNTKFTNETGGRSNTVILASLECTESGTFIQKEALRTIVYSADVSQSPAGGGTAWLKSWDQDVLAFDLHDWDNDAEEEIILTLILDGTATDDTRVMILDQATGALEAANRYLFVDL